MKERNNIIMVAMGAVVRRGRRTRGEFVARWRVGVRRAGWGMVMVMAMMVGGVVMSGSASALTAEQMGAISQNCGTMRQSLKSLQRSDSRVRVLLGTTYNTILTNYITPLNVRLVRNNYSEPRMAALQAEFAEARGEFAREFISYSQSLEELIATDCQREPEKFYTQLEVAREERAQVAETVAWLNTMVGEEVGLVTELMEGMK